MELLKKIKRKLYDARYIIIFILIIKILFFIFGVFFYSFTYDSLPKDNSLLSIFYNWDAKHYLTIAQHAYEPLERGEPFYLVFLPLWPFLIYILNLPIKNIMLSGILLANIFSLFGGILFFLTIKKDYGFKIALYATLLIFIFPASFYFHVPYTESLFFFLIMAFFYALRNERFFSAAIFGLLSSSTRIVGILLVVPFLFEYYSIYKLKINKKIFYPALIPLGIGLHMMVAYYYTGNFFAFFELQKTHWTHKSVNLLNIPLQFYEGLKSLFSSNDFNTNSLLTGRLEPLFSFFGIVVLLSGYRLLRKSYFYYGAVTFILILSQSFWLSNTRFIMLIFPIFIILAHFFTAQGERSYRCILGICWAFFCIMLMTYFFSRYVTGNITLL